MNENKESATVYVTQLCVVPECNTRAVERKFYFLCEKHLEERIRMPDFFAMELCRKYNDKLDDWNSLLNDNEDMENSFLELVKKWHDKANANRGPFPFPYLLGFTNMELVFGFTGTDHYQEWISVFYLADQLPERTKTNEDDAKLPYEEFARKLKKRILIDEEGDDI